MEFLENFGLSEQQGQEIIKRIREKVEGTVPLEENELTDGYGSVTVNLIFGPLRVECHMRPEEGEYRAMGLHMHALGDTVWHLKTTGRQPGMDDEDEACLLYTLQDAEEERHVSILVSNADILPSYVPNTPISLQMEAFPTEIHYYPDETACRKAHMVTTKDGIHMHFGNGCPVGVPGFVDMTMQAEVRSMQEVKVPELGGFAFCRVRVETEFGPLDIIHTKDIVPEDEIHFMREGAILFMSGVFSGNTAIGKYKDGALYDEDSLWYLLQDVFVFGNIVRLSGIFTEEMQVVRPSGEIIKKAGKETSFWLIDRLQGGTYQVERVLMRRKDLDSTSGFWKNLRHLWKQETEPEDTSKEYLKGIHLRAPQKEFYLFPEYKKGTHRVARFLWCSEKDLARVGQIVGAYGMEDAMGIHKK